MLKSKRDTIAGYLFSLPALCLYFVFTIYPFFYGAYISLSEWDGFNKPQFIGIQNYLAIFKDANIFESLSHNAVYAIGTVSVKLTFGFLLAMILNKKLKGITMFRTIFFIPVVLSFVAIGAVWTWIFNPTQGMLNNLLESAGLMDPRNPIAWLGDPRYALLAVMLVDIWKWIGYHMVLFLAGLKTISDDLYEAASIDGANSFQTMMHITIPQIKNVFYINLTFCLVGSFNVFDVIMVMTKGGPYGKTEVIAKYIYDTSFGSTNKFGYATAISIFVFILMLIVTLVILKLMRKSEEDM